MMYKHSRVIPVNCIVDTGSNYCLFRTDLAKPIGIDVTKGKKYILGGISRQIKEAFYFHSVKLIIAGSTIETNVGFSDQLPVAGVLGFHGFFDKFIVTFDATAEPPTFEVQRVPQQ